MDGGVYKGELYFTHGCPDSHGGDIWRERQKCRTCDITPPDEFITVATLMSEPKKEKGGFMHINNSYPL